jgi:uncharacterized membrane protein (DUF4010 family)
VDEVRPFAIAAAIGLLIGLEREWRQRARPHKLAGSRTLALLSLLGAIAVAIDPLVVAAGVVAVGLLLAVGYVRSKEPDVGLTTEVASLVAFVLGALAYDHPRTAVTVAVVVTVLLASRERLHRFAHEQITQVEIDDALKFFVAAFVILPLLPKGPHGPYGVLDAWKIWGLVVLITGIGWAGYVAVRVLGAARGLLVAGFAGGFVSGAATTATMARSARREGDSRPRLAAALLASVATLIQLGVVAAVASTTLARRVLPGLVAAGLLLVAEAGGIALAVGRAAEGMRERPPGRPFRLGPAVLVAAMLTGVLLLARWTADVAGSALTALAGGLAGFADVHATTAAMATLVSDGAISTRTGVAAVGAALAANTVTKCVLAFALGGRRFGARFLAAILAPAAAAAVAFAIAA